MYFSPHAVSAFNIETCKLHKSRKYVLNKRHVTAMELLAIIEFTVHYTRQITALILSKYIGLFALSRPRSNLLFRYYLTFEFTF